MKKLVLLSMVLVLCLATVGVGYAKWKDGQLEVDGQVCTSLLKVEWCYLDVDMCDPCNGAKLAEAKISDDGQKVSIKVEDAYPGVKIKVTLKARNAGTIPAMVHNLQINNDCPDGLKITRPWVSYCCCPSADVPDPEPCDESNPWIIHPKCGYGKFNAIKVWNLWAEVCESAGMNKCMGFELTLDYSQICKAPC